MKSILIIGALSDIGIAIAKKFAVEGYEIHLASRNSNRLDKIINFFQSNYKIKIYAYEFDALKIESHKEFIKQFKVLPGITICSVGLMGDQKINEKDKDQRISIIRTNYEGPMNILSEIANEYEKQEKGTIVGISSVAGARGRAKNYIYGSAKSGLITFLSGLRNRLAKKNINVITVLPGPVKTKMTAKMKLPKLFTATPEQVAKDVYKAVLKKKDVVYSLKIWRLIMILIKT